MAGIRIHTRVIGLILTLLLGACQGGSASYSENKSPLFVDVEKLAVQGNSEAQYLLGMMYNNGVGVTQSSRRAFEWFSKAADSGDPLGAYKVGCYYAGQGAGIVEIDSSKSLEFKLIAANAGYSFAQCDVGNTYYDKANYEEAVKWWKLSAAQGYPEAIGNLAVVHNQGKIVPRDVIFAYSYFKLFNLISKDEVNQKVVEALANLAATMTDAEVRKADEIVVQWKPEPSPLTERATSGMHAAVRLVQAVQNTP